jgi:superfamily I DNA and/or RNA helicase
MLEAQSLLPLVRGQCRYALLVGDPKQLPPTVAFEPTLLSTPLFVRLSDAGVEAMPMRTQYRLHPRLSALASSLFYEGRVLDGVCARERAPLLPGLPTLSYLDTTTPNCGQSRAVSSGGTGGGGSGGGGSGAGVSNAAEAQATKLIVRALLAAGVAAEQIGIICLYRAQVVAVSRALGKHYGGGGGGGGGGSMAGAAAASAHGGAGGGSSGSGGGGGGGGQSAEAAVLVSTVDAFQGAEREVMIVTAARTHAGVAGAALAFVANPNRLCVALTRARRHLVLVCSAHVLAENPLWNQALRAARPLPSADAWGLVEAGADAPAAEPAVEGGRRSARCSSDSDSEEGEEESESAACA